MTRVVIPWRHDDHRAPLLEFVLEWWQTRHPSWAVALADTPGEWSKAAAINRAAAEIDGIVVVADADVWCDSIGDAVEAVEAVSHVGLLFKLHLFLGLTVFLVFPFSRLVHIWSAPVTYPARPYQVVRQR